MLAHIASYCMPIQEVTLQTSTLLEEWVAYVSFAKVADSNFCNLGLDF